MIHVRVSAPVYPTEDPEKVIRAISELFTDMKIEKKDNNSDKLQTGIKPSSLLSGEGGIDLLFVLHGLIRREEIIDSVRNKIIGAGLSVDELSAHFLLNKQAAFVGIPSIPAQEEPLGSIEVDIRADSQEEMRRLFEWLFPQTENGKPVAEIEMGYVEKV